MVKNNICPFQNSLIKLLNHLPKNYSKLRKRRHDTLILENNIYVYIYIYIYIYPTK
ncbi:unnamed protein product [Brassica rapa subsp. narinosa]